MYQLISSARKALNVLLLVKIHVEVIEVVPFANRNINTHPKAVAFAATCL